MQTFLLELLSTDGRTLIMSVMAQGNTLYPPGTEPLKCIVTNYSSLTGSDKWVLASFMLFVFKPVLQDLTSMVRGVFLGNWLQHRPGFPLVFYRSEHNFSKPSGGRGSVDCTFRRIMLSHDSWSQHNLWTHQGMLGDIFVPFAPFPNDNVSSETMRIALRSA